MKNQIIIAPFSMHRDILNAYRKDNPFARVKIISKEELLSNYYGKYRKEALIYLLKEKSYSYAHAKELLKYMRNANDDFIELNETKNELIDRSLLVRNEYINELFKAKEVIVYGYSRFDKELDYVFDCLNIQLKYNLSKYSKVGQQISIFESAEEEVLFALNKISELVDNGINAKDISIVCLNNGYKYYLELYAPTFGLKLNINCNISLFTQELAVIFINKLYECKSIDGALNFLHEQEDSEIKDLLIETVNNNAHPELSFEQQYDLLVDRIKSCSLNSDIYDTAINVYDSLIHKEKTIIFVLSFVQGQFPGMYKDNDFYSDINKTKLHINTSLDKAKMEIELIEDFLGSDNTFYLSSSLRLGSENYYDSPFVEKFKLTKVKDEFPLVIYSELMGKMFNSKFIDLADTYYTKSQDYYALLNLFNRPRRYDNTYNGVKAYNEKTKVEHSYSAIDKFYSCPFAYYLERVLKIREDLSDVFVIKIGTIVHGVLQDSFSDGFDFETSFLKHASQIMLSKKEQILLRNIKKQTKIACDVSMLHISQYMKNARTFEEEKAEYTISANSKLVGIIDKAIVVDDKYLVIIDYKTGKTSFTPDYLSYGYSMQLPTYALLAMNNSILDKYEIAGLYINNVLPSSLKNEDYSDKLLPDYLKLNGVTINDMNAITSIDTTFDGVSSFIARLKYVKKTDSLSGVVSKEEIVSYIDTVKQMYQEADKKIRNNEFEIAPLIIAKKINACDRCSYADICFVRKEQKRIIVEEEDSDEMV